MADADQLSLTHGSASMQALLVAAMVGQPLQFAPCGSAPERWTVIPVAGGLSQLQRAAVGGHHAQEATRRI